MEIKATSALDLCLTFIDQNVLKGKRARNSKQVRCARVAGCILAKFSSSLMNSFTETEIKPLSPFLRHNSDIDIGKTKQQWILIIEMMSAWRRLNLQPKELLYIIHNIQKPFLTFLKTWLCNSTKKVWKIFYGSNWIFTYSSEGNQHPTMQN